MGTGDECPAYYGLGLARAIARRPPRWTATRRRELGCRRGRGAPHGSDAVDRPRPRTEHAHGLGIDEDTLTELYLAAAATVSRLAGSGRRADWRTARHLERAVIAAFRHEALGHWKSINAQKRRADRHAVSFDSERDGASHNPLERIFESDPRDELVARDWLAQLRGQVRDFWEPIILEGAQHKEAGDRLGVNKAQRQALYREGIEHLGRFRSLLEEGKVCQLRASAIVDLRAGTADAVTAERASAHLDCCLTCALQYDKQASALLRGILHLFPWPIIGRGVAWARELPVGRAAETAGGAGGVLLFGKGAAALCAGAVAAGVCATEFGVLPNPLRPPAEHEKSADSQKRSHPRRAATGGLTAALPPARSATTTTASDPASSASAGTKNTQQTAPRSRTNTATDDEAAAINEFDAEQAALRTKPKSSDNKPTATAARRPTGRQSSEFTAEPQTASSSASSASSASSSTEFSAPADSTSSSSGGSPSGGGSATSSTEFGGP